MADDFDPYSSEIANFEDDFITLCFDILDASYDTTNAYYATFPDQLPGRYAAPPDYVANIIARSPYDFDNSVFAHETYRDDIALLVQTELPVFLDDADLSAFDEVGERLSHAAHALDLAAGYDGFVKLENLMGTWTGEAAFNFQHRVLAKFGTMIVHQVAFIDELDRTGWYLRKVIERTRGDGLGLAQDLRKKVDIPTTRIPLGTILWVVGAIAAGVATFGGSAPAAAQVAFLAATSYSGLDQVQKLSGRSEGDRAIQGDTAYEFIPSCQEQIAKIIREGGTEVETLMEALADDLGDEAIHSMNMDRPKVIGMAEAGLDFELLGASGMSRDVKVESIADLRFGGAVVLPTMAQYFEDARSEVAGLGGAFDRAIGYSPVASPRPVTLTESIGVLADSFRRARDFLYEAGVALVNIADTFFETDQLNAEMIANFNQQIAEVDFTEFPRYAPPTPTGAAQPV